MIEQPTNLRWCCEQFLMEIVQLSPAMAGIKSFHLDERGSAEVDRVIYGAKVGNKDLGGCRPFQVTVTIMFATGQMSAVQTGSVLGAIYQQVFAPVGNIPGLNAYKYFSFFDILPSSDSDREALKKSRRNFVDVSLLAKLI